MPDAGRGNLGHGLRCIRDVLDNQLAPTRSLLGLDPAAIELLDVQRILHSKPFQEVKEQQWHVALIQGRLARQWGYAGDARVQLAEVQRVRVLVDQKVEPEGAPVAFLPD